MTQRRVLRLSAKASVTAMALVLLAPSAKAQELEASTRARLPARAGEFSLKIEPGVAFPLTRPQSQLFNAGGIETIKGLWALAPYVDIGPSVTFVGLPADAPRTKPGTAWAFGGSVRLKWPHHASGGPFSAISPWLDVDLLYVRTDLLDRAGFMAGAGVAVPLGEARVFWLGPFVRYFQILNGQRSGFDDGDARISSIGLSLEIGSGVERERELTATEVAGVRVIDKEIVSCPDRDADGIPDSIDRCPEVPGPMDHWGCRQYDKIVVKSDKLELKEKLYFAWDQATLQDVSYPVLDEVVVALNENKQFRVQVEGHSSSDGADDHNQQLSEQRAQAVLDYLVAHGIAKERLGSKGFSSSVPLDTNATVGGRENNRRVEFVVNFNIVDGGGK